VLPLVRSTIVASSATADRQVGPRHPAEASYEAQKQGTIKKCAREIPLTGAMKVAGRTGVSCET
jgi:hypothetical protein